MGKDARRRSPAARCYRRLVNHQAISTRFHGHIDDARSIYEALEDWFKNDAHFWLQFGSLELEHKEGDLDHAANYVGQAESLSPDDDFIQTAKGHISYRRAREAKTIQEAAELRARAEEILLEQVSRRGKRSPYPFHILGSQRLGYARHWYQGEGRRPLLVEAQQIVKDGLERHPRHHDLRELEGGIQKAILELALGAK